MNHYGWLVYKRPDAERNAAYIDWMMEEAARLGIKLDLMLRENFSPGSGPDGLFIGYNHTRIDLPAFAIVRCADHLFTRHLELLGIRAFNSSQVSAIANHKARTYQYLAPFGIPMLDTVFVRSDGFRPDMVDFALPWVVKGVNGRGGRQVFMARSYEEAGAIIQNLPRREAVIQKVAGTIGRDLRVFVVGKEIIAAVLRSSDTDFRANYSLGGRAQSYPLSDAEKNLVHRIINVLDFDMVGIDFLFDGQGRLLFNEIEDVAGSRTLSLTTDINIVRLYLQHILKKISGI